MSTTELFNVFNEQLFDQLQEFFQSRKDIYTSFIDMPLKHIDEYWPEYARHCVSSLNQIATASRLERFEYQETLTDNIKSLQNNPEALSVVKKSRDQSILLEFFARALSLLYYETLLTDHFTKSGTPNVLEEYANQSQELGELILFGIGKELLFDSDFVDIMRHFSKSYFSSNITTELKTIEQAFDTSKPEILLEQRIRTLQQRGLLYKKHFTKILAVVSEEFWWNDYLLEYFLYTRANEYYTKAKDLLEDNPLDPSLLMSINYEISLCETNAKIALGKFYLELAVNTLLEDKHAKAYEYFIFSQKHFSEAHEFLETSNYNTKQNKILQSVIEQNSQYSQSFAKLLAISCSIIEFTTEKLSAKKLKARIKSLHALIEAPLESFDYINQAEFINTVGFIIENLTLLSKHEKLTQEDIKTEMEKGFKRMGRIFEGRIDSISKNFLALPWEEDKKDRQVKYNFCETETAKLQDILIAILLMPSYVSNRKGLIAKTRSLLEVIQSEFYHLKGLEESNNTKALCLFVKYYLKAKEAFDNLSLGKIKGPLEEFVNTAFIQSFVKSHLKEASILQNGNQYFFARYLLRILPDILDMSEITKAPKEIAELLIEYHGSLFDSLITIWERLTQHYQAILEHKQTYDAPDFIVNWDYIEKKKHHTKGALLFYKSCQAFVQAQEYAKLKNRVKAEKLFRQADKNATESANIFNSVIDSLKGEVKKLPQDLYSFASYCKTQSQKVSSGKPIDKIPIREFVVLIGIISGSL